MIEIFYVVQKVFLIILAISIVLLLPRFLYAIMGFGKQIVFTAKNKKNTKFAILIPARNESNVIEELLSALSNQNYPKQNFDVFVIVKEQNDKSIKIAEKFDYTALVCKNQKCKGDALDFAVQYVYNNNLSYDAFLVFDADNVPSKNFLKEMDKAVLSGYDIGIGYRNSKNWNDGWVASSTGLTFSLVNTLSNKGRSKLGVNCIFSGTGYFISEKVIAKEKAWTFKTLTEDYEISLYATLNNLKTTYVEKAEFFDEQPCDIKTSIKQRVRWVKGFMMARKLYAKKIAKSIFTQKQNKWSKIEQTVGILPVAFIVASTIIYLLFQIGFAVASIVLSTSAMVFLFEIFKVCLITYAVLVIFTAIQFLAEISKINITTKNMIKTLLFNPFYTALYIPVAIKAIFSKNIGWDKIEHNKSMADANIESLRKPDEIEDETKAKHKA